jgi:hypothetical protein
MVVDTSIITMAGGVIGVASILWNGGMLHRVIKQHDEVLKKHSAFIESNVTVKDKVDGHEKVLFGNGQPGIVDVLRRLEAEHDLLKNDCVKHKA